MQFAVLYLGEFDIWEQIAFGVEWDKSAIP